jgi:xanthine dehydrogenase YagR molybdenum-binding subunit
VTTGCRVARSPGGSATAGSLSGAQVNACDAARDRLLEAPAARDGPFADVPVSGLRLEGGEMVGPNGAREPLAAIPNRMPAGVLEVEGEWAPAGMTAENVERARRGGIAIAGPSYPTFSAAAFGAEFVECEFTRGRSARRAWSGCSRPGASCVPRPRTASCWAYGLGLSNALLEETEIDRKRARFVNANIAEYHVAFDVEMLDEKDKLVNPLGAKGIGELGIVGTSAAVATAVYHATGIRVRKTPILTEDILPLA